MMVGMFGKKSFMLAILNSGLNKDMFTSCYSCLSYACICIYLFQAYFIAY